MNRKIASGNLSTRFAEVKDYKQIKSLLKSVNLPTEGILENIINFIVLSHEGKLVGTVGLERYGDKALLRSLAVTKQFQKKGYGRRLCNEIIIHARELKITEIYLLTDTAEEFFKSRGFIKIDRDKVDKRVKSSLEFRVLCPASAACLYLKIG